MLLSIGYLQTEDDYDRIIIEGKGCIQINVYNSFLRNDVMKGMYYYENEKNNHRTCNGMRNNNNCF